MPSQARQDLDDRLGDIDQLLQAHEVLTKFKKAEAAANTAGGGLQNLTNAVSALVTVPGRGRPAEVSALNRSAFVLLTAHFQGFVDDLHREAAQHTLAGKVTSINNVVKLVKPRNSNPHVNIIEQMFAGIGIFDLMRKPHWKNCSNSSVRSRLTDYIRERNQIAHGSKPTIHKSKVTSFKDYVVHLANALDTEVSQQIRGIAGNAPW